MKKMIKKIICSTVLLFTATYANATVYPVTKVSDLNEYTTTVNPVSVKALSFSLANESDVTLDYSTIKTTGWTFGGLIASLLNKTTGTIDVLGDTWFTKGQSSGSLNFSNLTAGNYILNLATAGNSKLNLSFQVAAVPEPETYALMGVGFLGLLAASRRKQKSAPASRMTAA